MVYEPAEDSELLKKYVKKYAFGSVLDMGTGSGIQAIEASKKKKVNAVLGIDIDKKVVKELKKIKTNSKIKIKRSDLFSAVNGKFDTIIFNPPYLPQDKGVEDLALYGGKKGWEISKRFFDKVGNFLEANGKILFLFSSLTDKKRIEEIISENLFVFKELGRVKLPFFEELYVYLVEKSKLLKELNVKGIKNINYLAKGKRGKVFVGVYRGKKVAIKVKREDSLAKGRITNEINWLKILNKKMIGPKLLFYGVDFMVYWFVEGTFFPVYLEKQKRNSNKIKKVVIRILKQCFELDQLGVNKEEMHRPIKHVIVSGGEKVSLIDFERCYKTKKPHNVTQFGDFLMSWGLVGRKKMKILLRKYKKEQNLKNFKEIITLLK